MKRYIAIMTVVACILTRSADALGTGEFKGFQTVNVTYNGKSIEGNVPAVNFYGNTMIPLRQMGSIFGAIINWKADTSTVQIVKPHIDMILCDYYGEASSVDEAVRMEDPYGRDLYVDKIIGNPFSKFETGTYSFNAFFDVSGLEPGNEYVDRVMIVDPDENVIYNTNESEAYTVEEGNTGYIYTLGFESVSFSKPGIYKFLFQFKQGNGFVTVYEREVEAY